MKRVVMALLATAGMAGAASAQVQMNLLTTVDLFAATANDTSSKFIGQNVAGVAWDGQNVYVGGYRNAATGRTALVRVSDVYGAQTMSDAFGIKSNTASTRGYFGLKVKGNTLYAGFENGAADVDGISQWDVSGTPTKTASFTSRAVDIAFNPGFGGVAGQGSGLGWVTFGNGRQLLQNESNVATQIYGPTGSATPGYIHNDTFAGSGTNFRGLDFDGQGNLYTRKGNWIFKSTRTGANSGTQPATPFVNPQGNTTLIDLQGQDIAFVNSQLGQFLVYNDRRSTGLGQQLGNVIKFVDMNGVAQTITWSGIDPSLISGNGYYAFDFHAASNTLAVSDFTNKKVYIFGIPTPGAVAAFGLAGLMAARRRR